MQTLWIFGDSFSAEWPDYRDTWPRLLALKLDTYLENYSLPGASADWIWLQIQEQMAEIEPNDTVIVLLTEPSRYWFWEDRPETTNLNNVDNRVLLPIEQRAMELYTGMIQRPQLDTLCLEHRLGWLDSQAARLGFRPRVVRAFNQWFNTELWYPNLQFVQGSLIDISVGEVYVGQLPSVEPRATDIFNLWLQAGYSGRDPRPNHMTLDNHRWLADRLAENQGIEQGWSARQVNWANLQNPVWCRAQLGSKP